MLSQEDFDRFTESYNEDFCFLLTRASTGHYECLLSSFLVLKDLREVIEKLHSLGSLNYKVDLHPLFFRANDGLLASLGFDPEQMSAIYGFLDYVKRVQGVEFEQCLTEGINRNCLPVAGSA
jgi:hypothetical protein